MKIQRGKVKPLVPNGPELLADVGPQCSPEGCVCLSGSTVGNKQIERARLEPCVDMLVRETKRITSRCLQALKTSGRTWMSVWMERKQRNGNKGLWVTRKDAGVDKSSVRFMAVVFPQICPVELQKGPA